MIWWEQNNFASSDFCATFALRFWGRKRVFAGETPVFHTESPLNFNC